MVHASGATAAIRLSKELRDLNNDSVFSVGLENENDVFLWNVCFEGSDETIYEGGYFKAQLKFPLDYPNNPPEMRFVTPMWHPNIYPDGKVCISILHPPGTDAMNEQETADERWRPILNVESILLSVISMLNDPNVNSPANLDASKQFKENRVDYEKKVRKMAQNSMDYV